ncbi:hypothetical protein ACQ4PT_068095 [Festuca glaucescens]
MATPGGGGFGTGDGGFGTGDGGFGTGDGLDGGRCGASRDDDGVDIMEFCGSSNPLARDGSLFPADASALAKVWKEQPANSHRWTSSLGGVDLDDEVWDVRFHLDGKDNLERQLGRSDITYMNLLAMLEIDGYGWGDIMYYVREEGAGIARMALIKSMVNVEEMLAQYESAQCVSITVIKGKSGLPAGINRKQCEEQIPISEIGVVYSVDMQGVLFGSQQSNENEDDSNYHIVHVDTEQDYVLTQQSHVPVIPINSDDDDLNKKIIDLKRRRDQQRYSTRPFIGLDGCFVKLTTGQQILAATGRDGNNNIFPIAFRLVDKEDKTSWTWFLNQLKAAIGEESPKFGNCTIISDRQKDTRASHDSVATPAATFTASPTPAATSTASPTPAPATSSSARPPKPPASSARQAQSAPAPQEEATRARAQAQPTRAAPPKPRSFVPPRSNPPESTSCYRPVRNKRMPKRLQGYFTASRIHEKSVEELQREGR